jgi:uncharacterized membrane protein YdjX (TVP38/TMEM64 family)
VQDPPSDISPPTEPGALPAAEESLSKALGPVGVLGVLWTAAPAIAGIFLWVYAGTVSAWFRSHQDIGPLIYVAIFIVTAGLGFLPTYAQAALGGFAFGMWIGVPAALAGFVGGSLIGYEVASRVSGERVVHLLKHRPRYAAARDALVEGGFWKTLAIVALLRLPPNSPFALTNLVMASVRVKRPVFLLGTLIGMTPRTTLAVFIGHSVEQLTKESLKSALPSWVWIVGIVLTIIAMGVIGIIAQRAMDRVTGVRQSPESAAPDPASLNS